SGGTASNSNPVAVRDQRLVPQGAVYHPPAPRPNPNVSSGAQWVDQGTSSYHALDVSLTKRLKRGFTFNANYTYGKAMDYNSAINAPSAGNEPSNLFSPYYRRLNRGIASYSLAHQFNAFSSYQLPFRSANGVLDKLIGGWQWNGSFRVTGGFPFTPVVGSNTS